MKSIQFSDAPQSEPIVEGSKSPFEQKQFYLIKRLLRHIDSAQCELDDIRAQIKLSQNTGSKIERMWKQEVDRMSKISYTIRKEQLRLFELHTRQVKD